MKKSKQFSRNVIYNSGATAAGSVIQLALLAVLARRLVTDDFAGFLYAMSIIAIIDFSSDFGARIWAVRKFAITKSIGHTLCSALTGKLFYSLISAVVLVLIPFKIIAGSEIILCFLVGVTQPSTDPLLWYLRARERMDTEAKVILGWRISVSSVIVMGVLFGGFSLTGLLGVWLLINILRIMVETRIPLIAGLLRVSNFSFRELSLRKASVIYAVFPMGAAFLLMALYQRLGILGLERIGESSDIALFGAAFTLVASSVFIAVSITLASFPQIAVAVESNDMDVVSSLIRSKLSLISWIVVPLCFVGFIVSPYIVSILYGRDFVISGIVIVVMLPGIYISSINFALKYSLNANNLNWGDVISVIIGMGVFLFTFLYLKSLPLPIVAGISWVLGEFSAFISRWIILVRIGKFQGLNLIRVLVLLSVLSFTAYIRFTYFI